MKLGKACLILFLFFGLYFGATSIAQVKDKPLSKTSSSSLFSQYVKININNASTFICNDGQADLSPSGDSGFQYPPGSGNTSFYKSGFLWGAKVNNQIRTGGSCYLTSLKPGKILENGKPEDPNSLAVRAYRVRPDYKSGDFTNEIIDEGKDRQTIYNQYEKDWNEWPAKSGAPFNDVNKNGIYEPSIDIPGVPGADQTVWFVANDFDSVLTKSNYGVLPLGIEMQTTVWAYNREKPLNNMIFKRYLIINKSKTNFEDMYFGIWSDPDLGGDAGDDLVGCDTLLNMDFCYNGDDSDPSYGKYSPACGFCLLQGPVTNGNANDVAKFHGRQIAGKKNLQMTALGWFGKAGPINHDPYITSFLISSTQVYNLLQGKNNDGSDVPDPIKGGITRFPFSGDPINGTGFLGGVTYPNGWRDTKADHRMTLCSGPFNMAVGDTQEVIFAQMVAGGNKGESRFAALSLVKQAAEFSRIFYKNNFNSPSVLKAISSVNATEMDREIILTWGEDLNKISEIENTSESLFSFQGYNVYQISKEEKTPGEKKRIATFDVVDSKRQIVEEVIDPFYGSRTLVIKQFGTDSGVQRFISINKDYFYSTTLNNGSDYDFGVSYYRTRSDDNFVFKCQESPLTIISAKPQSTNPGVRYECKHGDIIPAKHIGGTSKSIIEAMIIDPSKVTGNEYEIIFNKLNNRTVFSLINISTNQTLLTKQSNLNGDNDYLITDGFILKVKDNTGGLLTDKDVYRVKLPGVFYEYQNAELDLNKINVFPNPYNGNYRNEFNKYDRHVTFSHLPHRAIIRIFNLAGQLIRKLEKDSPDQFLRWNMLNNDNYQLPTGLYIVHIELPDFKKTRVLKLGIVTDTFIPDHY